VAAPGTDIPGDEQAAETAGLARAALFAGVEGSILQSVLAAAIRRVLPARSVLFRQGDASDYLHLLTRGHMKVGQVDGAGNPLIVRFMGPGDFVGCVASFRHVPYPATATAVTESAVLSWPSGKIAAFMERHPQMATNALDMVGSRTEEMLHRLREMATERVESRIAKTLLRLAGGEPTPQAGVEIGFAVSRQDIAEMAGTDLYNVSRVLSRWKRLGIVDTHRQRIVIRAVPSLNKLAGGDD
jgi:CRP-like cAMP-binding protein